MKVLLLALFLWAAVVSCHDHFDEPPPTPCGGKSKYSAACNDLESGADIHVDHHHGHDHHHHHHDHDHDHHHHDHDHHHDHYHGDHDHHHHHHHDDHDHHHHSDHDHEQDNPVDDQNQLQDDQPESSPELTHKEMFKRGHMQPFGYHRPPDGEVEELNYMIAPEDFYQHFVAKHRPVLFKGMAKHWKAYNSWTDSYLREKYGDLEFKMETKDDDKTVFLSSRKLNDFLDAYETGNLYLVDEVAPEMRDEVTMPLCLRCEEISTKFFVTYFWMSSGGTNSSIHEDTDENMLCVIRGSKRTLLISPSYSHDLYADDANVLGFSPVPADKVDLEKYPRVMNVRYTVANMEEGDMLYLPQMWWHQVNSGKGRQQAVAMWWKSKPWWKSSDKHAMPRDPEDAKNDLSSAERKFSFSSILAYYERWIQKTGHLVPRPKCESQYKTMADFHFESDNYETEMNVGIEGDEEEHIDRECEFDQSNPNNPCAVCNASEEEDEDEIECVKLILEYCSKHDDRGCVVMLPQHLNRLDQEQYREILEELSKQ
ncbi:uncharacterized protein LOC144443519 [Glandiceps talaboti]